jgi:hypothetical protein
MRSLTARAGVGEVARRVGRRVEWCSHTHPASRYNFHKIDLDFNFIELNNLNRKINFIEVRHRMCPPNEESPRKDVPAWLGVMDEEDLQFLRRFLWSSGSLKALAEEYGVSYPTVRARLDRLIAKAQAAEDPRISDPFERKLRVLVADAKVSPGLAKELMAAHRESMKRRDEK